MAVDERMKIYVWLSKKDRVSSVCDLSISMIAYSLGAFRMDI